MAEKTGFILFYEMLDNLKYLGNDIVVEVLTALSQYDQGKKVDKLSPQAQFAFNAYIPALKKSKRRWETSVINGSNGGKGKAGDNLDEPDGNLPEPSDNLDEPSDNLGQCVIDNVIVNVNVNEKENAESLSFSEPLRNESNQTELIPDKLPETKEEAGIIFEKARKFWNKHKPLPECRNLITNIPGTEIEDVLRTLQHYALPEIENAIVNYHWHLTGECGPGWAQVMPYGSFYGFLKKGVARYFDDESVKSQFKQGVYVGSKK